MNKKTIPTAEELAEEMFIKNKGMYSSFDRLTFTGKQTKEIAIAFAKLHVEEAQKSYFEKIKQEGLVTEAGVAYLENAYHLTNIK